MGELRDDVDVGLRGMEGVWWELVGGEMDIQRCLSYNIGFLRVNSLSVDKSLSIV